MIYFVEGEFEVIDPNYVVVNVGGMGYQLHISLTTYAKIKDMKRGRLLTHFHVREDLQTLYGFFEPGEKQIFTSLISVNGIGASTAMMILSTLSPKEITAAISTEDVSTIKSVKGIGLKTAQRVVLELKDKILKTTDSGGQEILSTTHNTTKKESLSALVTLGLPKTQAEKAIDKVMQEKGTDIKVEDVIRLVLKSY